MLSGHALVHTRQRFHFQIIPFSCENQHEASFYIKEQTQKNKFKIWVLKTTIFDPPKSVFLGLGEKKTQQNFVFGFGFDSALKTINVWMSFGEYCNIENELKKAFSCQKHYFGCFWWLLIFFVHFQKYWPK